MHGPSPLTRKELAEFLPDLRSIKAFEAMFTLLSPGDNSLEVKVQEASIDANTAVAKANQAVGGTIMNEIKTKSNGVLLWLMM
jgi:hypothetical protein